MTRFSDPNHADLLATIAAGADARRKTTADAERTKIESWLAEHVRRIMPDQLKEQAEIAKHEAATIDKDAARAFAGFVRDRELILPVTGTTAGAYIIDLLLAEDADMARLHRAARAIEHIHAVGEFYFDPKPLRAALKFCEVCSRSRRRWGRRRRRDRHHQQSSATAS